MKKAEAISILATSVRPREPKDRARYDEAVKMAIEALKCSETPKSSERTSETAQADHTADIGKMVCVDAISRQETIHAISDWLYDTTDERLPETVIRSLSAVQPERKNGHWLRYGEDGYPNNEDTVFWQCDQCLEQYTGRTKRIPNFCPNCGADMRKENES